MPAPVATTGYPLPLMQNTTHLLKERRFLPLFVTQSLNAFNDSVFKQLIILYATYRIYNDARLESQFNAVAQALFILPFFLLSSLAGQLADMRDKAKIIRIVKAAEIVIMLFGSAAFLLAGAHQDIAVGMMLAGVFAMGVHSTFFGPIKYAILPQHLHADEVLGGTGLVEAATYIAILGGTIVAGLLTGDERVACVALIATAVVGWLAGREVPAAPPSAENQPLDFHIIRASARLVSATMHIPRLFLAIIAISFFWSIGAVIAIILPPLVKNVLHADERVASLFLAVFSVGIAIGSILVNRLLKSEVSARYAPGSVIVMGLFVLLLRFVVDGWERAQLGGDYLTISQFLAWPGAHVLLLAFLGIATAGGMFVVPLYAFLTTTVDKSLTARTIAANNIVNSGAMVGGSAIAFGLSALHVSTTDQLFLIAAMCLVSAWLAWKLHLACD
jgi:Na+/melibiose symporter-like transporter